MDLSQQELPLTSYFTRGKKETKPVTYSSKKRKQAEDADSGGSSKKGKTDAGKAAKKSTSGPKAHVKSAQLPTPSTSARKHVPSSRGVQGVLAKAQFPPSTTEKSSFAKKQANDEPIDLTQTETEDTPSKVPPKRRAGKEKGKAPVDEVIAMQSLATPASSNLAKRRTRVTSFGEAVVPTRQSLRLAEAALPTPETGLRRVSASASGMAEATPSAGPSRRRHQPSRLSIVSTHPSSPSSLTVLSPVRFTAASADSVSRSRVNSGDSAGSHVHDEEDPFTSPVEYGAASSKPSGESETFGTTRQPTAESHTLDATPVHIPDVPMNPVPSSQSQYLLHPDATPKRKRVARRVEVVHSSQTQEERELTESMPPPLIPPSAMRKLSVGESSRSMGPLAIDMRTPRPNVHTPRAINEHQSQHVYTLGSSPLTSPGTSPHGPSRSFVATKKALDELSFFKSPSRGRRTSPYRSPARKLGSPSSRKPAREDSIENVPPVPEDDSVTESESESELLLRFPKRTPNKLKGFPSPERARKTSPSRPTSHDTRSPLSRKLAREADLPFASDDSATEPESDTDILHCVTEIGKRKTPRQPRAPSTPRRPLISPLVSPARSRYAGAGEASLMGSTQFLMQEGAGMSVPGTYTSPSRRRASARRRLAQAVPSESVPSVVREFMDMFDEGDGSYPEDFPESLRV
ncbi:hypothetical protein HYDPIDRAFT_164501 [Hydnomerulius pinastri MD-312]|nr:hypothetical protein HYDPIDRAFT_164501 [Hydnomerulius pinastri MD-312]